jgi:hypothetical protein
VKNLIARIAALQPGTIAIDPLDGRVDAWHEKHGTWANGNVGSSNIRGTLKAAARNFGTRERELDREVLLEAATAWESEKPDWTADLTETVDFLEDLQADAVAWEAVTSGELTERDRADLRNRIRESFGEEPVSVVGGVIPQEPIGFERTISGLFDSVAEDVHRNLRELNAATADGFVDVDRLIQAADNLGTWPTIHSVVNMRNRRLAEVAGIAALFDEPVPTFEEVMAEARSSNPSKVPQVAKELAEGATFKAKNVDGTYIIIKDKVFYEVSQSGRVEKPTAQTLSHYMDQYREEAFKDDSSFAAQFFYAALECLDNAPKE